MRRFFHGGVLMLMAAWAVAPALGQSASGAASGKLSDDTLQAWNSTAKKLIEMAEDFPEERYDYRPTAEVRSFKAILLHIAGVNYMFINPIRPVGVGEEDPSPQKFATKKDVVAYLTRSFADGAAVLAEKGDAGQLQMVKHPFADRMTTQHSLWMMGIEHAAEHYGNLVVYYRLNRLVPPATRPRR